MDSLAMRALSWAMVVALVCFLTVSCDGDTADDPDDSSDTSAPDSATDAANDTGNVDAPDATETASDDDGETTPDLTFDTAEDTGDSSDTSHPDLSDDQGGDTSTDTTPAAQRLVVELFWVTPADTSPNTGNGTDLSVHVLHPSSVGELPDQRAGGPSAVDNDLDGDGTADGWFSVPGDCYWLGTRPWGCSVPFDANDGWGPENANATPVDDGTYRVGVDYWNDNGLGSSTATVRIYVDDVVVLERSAELIERDFWVVADVSWPSGAVTAVDTAGSPLIYHDVTPAP